jgi:phosphoglycerate-specific signal transduction histidine kinase
MKLKTEDRFQYILTQLDENRKRFEDKIINFIKYSERIDYLFNNYSWSKKDFYEELNKRIQ